MKKVVLMLMVVSLVAAGIVFAGGKSNMELKAGDSVYACNCGEKCPCQSLAKTEAKCTCDKPMVKATVVKVDADSAVLKAAGWDKDRTFKTTGKYMCACGASCNCDMISQNPGKCGCGNDMKKVE